MEGWAVYMRKQGKRDDAMRMLCEVSEPVVNLLTRYPKNKKKWSI